MTERLVVIVAPPGVTLQDATGPWEAFCRAALYVPGAYRVVMASTEAETRVSTKFGIFVRDGSNYTSAGITAGIDLALALVEEDCGSVMEQMIARDLVVFVQRQARQAQVSATLTHRMADRASLRELQRWIPDHLQSIVGVSDLATRVNISPRNCARLFKRETGVSPGLYLRQVRAEAAQRRLQESRGKQAVVASQVGFGPASAVRYSIIKE